MRNFGKKMALALGLTALGASPLAVQAHDMPNMTKHKTPAAFEKLKGLVGKWSGKQKMGEKNAKITVSYELTAGGSALVERLFQGTPHEMTSVYYTEGNQVCMAHYCMLGNHPIMTLKKSEGNSLTFEMKGTSGISSAKEAHMHGMTLTWVDANHIRSEWTEYVDGKKAGECVGFNLAREKSEDSEN